MGGGVAAELARRRPQVLVCDFFLLGALAAGEGAGVPTAALVHNSSVNWPLPGLPLPPQAVIAAIWARSVTWVRSLTSVVGERTQNGLPRFVWGSAPPIPR